jgi:FkbM family methyltransferase
LRYNIALHGVGEKVVVVDKAAGDAHGYAKLPTSISSSESSFTKHLRNELRLLDVDVEVITIEDPVLESIGVKGVESLVMKVDVEGFWVKGLGGAAKTVERFRLFILFEVHRTFDDEGEVHALKMLKCLAMALQL